MLSVSISISPPPPATPAKNLTSSCPSEVPVRGSSPPPVPAASWDPAVWPPPPSPRPSLPSGLWALAPFLPAMGKITKLNGFLFHVETFLSFFFVFVFFLVHATFDEKAAGNWSTRYTITMVKLKKKKPNWITSKFRRPSPAVDTFDFFQPFFLRRFFLSFAKISWKISATTNISGKCVKVFLKIKDNKICKTRTLTYLLRRNWTSI